MFDTTTIESDAIDADYTNPIVMETAEYEELEKKAAASEEAYGEFSEKLGDLSDLRGEVEELRSDKSDLEDQLAEYEEMEERQEEIQDIKEAMAEELAEDSSLFSAEELAGLEFSNLRSKFQASESTLVPRGGDAGDDEIEETENEGTELSAEDQERKEALQESIEMFEGRDGWESALEDARDELAEIEESE